MEQADSATTMWTEKNVRFEDASGFMIKRTVFKCKVLLKLIFKNKDKLPMKSLKKIFLTTLTRSNHLKPLMTR